MTIYVLCVRDPDASNEYTIEPADADVEVIDVDLGYEDLDLWGEFWPWAHSHLFVAKTLPESSSTRAAIQEIVWSQFQRRSDGFRIYWPDTRDDIIAAGGRSVPLELEGIDNVDHLFTLLNYLEG